MDFLRRGGGLAGTLGVLLLVSSGWTLSAQSLETGQVREITPELVMGLLARPYQTAATDDPRLFIGALPPDMESLLYVPDGAIIHGSVAYGARGTVVVTVARTPAELWDEYQREMELRGWTPRDSGKGAIESLGGVSIPWVYCRDQAVSAFVTVMEREETMSRLRIDYSTEGNGSPCDPRIARGRQQSRMEWLAPPPPTDLSIGACGNEVSGGASQSGTFSSSLPGNELLRHYTAQLEGRGWTPLGDRPGVEFMTSRFVLREETGTESVTLLLAPVPDRPGCWSMLLHSTRLTSGDFQEDPRPRNEREGIFPRADMWRGFVRRTEPR